MQNSAFISYMQLERFCSLQEVMKGQCKQFFMKSFYFLFSQRMLPFSAFQKTAAAHNLDFVSGLTGSDCSHHKLYSFQTGYTVVTVYLQPMLFRRAVVMNYFMQMYSCSHFGFDQSTLSSIDLPLHKLSDMVRLLELC